MITNPVKAIRAYCLQCCCGQVSEVQRCTIEACALYPFRFGKNPYRAHTPMPEHTKEALRIGREQWIQKKVQEKEGSLE